MLLSKQCKQKCQNKYILAAFSLGQLEESGEHTFRTSKSAFNPLSSELLFQKKGNAAINLKCIHYNLTSESLTVSQFWQTIQMPCIFTLIENLHFLCTPFNISC